MPKSEDYWQWKHVNNPFGPSPVLLAEEGGEIIGVRAFMKWQWQKGNEKVTAIRAVDTATHPDHQGKGIFKKLTLGLLDQCEQEGVHLVFNTPNQKSKPGYLKMGWEEAGKLPVKLSVKRPFQVLMSKLSTASETKFLKLPGNDYSLEQALDHFNEKQGEVDHWQTAYSKRYLKWRYLQIPIIPYYGHFDDDAVVIFRLKQGALGVELRICDSFGLPAAIKQLLKEVYHTCSFDYITQNGFSSIQLPGILKQRLNIGPDVTVRNLAKKDLSGFTNFSSWHPSFGDLEVF